MPNLYLQQSDGTPVATFRLYHDFAARAGQEEVVVLGIIPEAASANSVPAGSYTRTDDDGLTLLMVQQQRDQATARAEKAERERDKARDGARVAFARYREVEKARQEVVDELYSLRPAAQESTDAGPHELDESDPIRNLGYYRSSARCKCGYEVIWGEHDGDAGLDEAWRVHIMRSAVHAFRAARRDEEKQDG